MKRNKKRKLLNHYKYMVNYHYERAEKEHIENATKEVKIKCLEIRNKMLLDKIADLEAKLSEK